MADKDFIKRLFKLEAAGGASAYTPLIIKLKDVADAEERRKITRHRVPSELLMAFQDSRWLRNIMDVVEKYPELIPEILMCAYTLREDKALPNGMEHESNEYKDFILSLEKRYFEKA